MLLLLFGALNSGGRIQELGNIPYVTFFLPGILAYGIVITQFVNMAGGIAIQRDNGLLKRMRGTPLPGWAYVAGRVGSTAARLGRHDRRHADPRTRLLRRAPARRGGAGRRRHRAARRGHLRRAGHGGRHDHPQRRGRSRRRQRADPAALLHLGHLVPAHRRAGVARRRGEVLPGRAPGQRAARRLRPAQPRVGVVGQRPLRAGDLAARRARAWRCASGSGRWRAERGTSPIASGCPRRASRASSRSSSRCRPSSGCWATSPAPGAHRWPSAPRSSSSSPSSSRPCAGRMHPKPPAVVARAYVIDLAIAARADRRRPARLEPALLLRRGHGRPAPAAAVERRRPAGHRA